MPYLSGGIGYFFNDYDSDYGSDIDVDDRIARIDAVNATGREFINRRAREYISEQDSEDSCI